MICEVPKGKGALRPGAHLSLVDRVVYAACVGALLDKARPALTVPGGSADFACILADDATKPDWTKKPFFGWRDFEIESIKKIDDGCSHVAIADVAGFYDNIDIETLMSDLHQIGAESVIVEKLRTCLHRWELSRGRGIPQG
jgi:hypothetical protein